MPADGKAQGGLSVPAPNVWKVATGFTGRRPIVDNEKCKTCHATIGVTPSFHAGQRNDGPTCSFCHNPPRQLGLVRRLEVLHPRRPRRSQAHGQLHLARPGSRPWLRRDRVPGHAQQLHNMSLPNTYDFTNATNLNAIAGQQLTTVATGIYDSNPLTNSTYYTLSPYITADGVTNYGNGFSYNAATNVTTGAAGTTLVRSPITGACSSCHDSAIT